MKKVGRLWGMFLCTIMFVSGCQSVTARINRRAEAHVVFHAARFLNCEEKKIRVECAAAYHSGECYKYAVSGCNAAVGYQNLPGEGWTAEQ